MPLPFPPPGNAVCGGLADAAVTGAGNSAGSILVVGAAALRVAERIRSCGRDVVIGVPESFHRTADRYAAVVAAGLIEYDPWDRWALQRLHGVLAPGGVLVLAVPLLSSAATLFEPRFLIGFAAKQIGLLSRRLTKSSGSPPRFRGRKYRPSAIPGILAGLGFAVLGNTPAGWGHRIVVARRLPSMAGFGPERPLPEPTAIRAAFERDHMNFIGIREAWRAQHVPGAPAPPRMLRPEDYAGHAALVLAPHPDDEIIGCGGTLARLIAAGARVTAVQATDGSDSAAFSDTSESDRRTIRLAEANLVSKAIDFSETVYWREDNRAFRHTPQAVDRLAALIARVRPRLVFIPFVTDIHPDHLTLSRILADALAGTRETAGGMEVLNYEVWSLVPANTCCDVTSVMPLQERLLLMYETAMKVDDYVHFIESHKAYNAAAYLGVAGYADAYFSVPATEYPAWLRASLPLHVA